MFLYLFTFKMIHFNQKKTCNQYFVNDKHLSILN